MPPPAPASACPMISKTKRAEKVSSRLAVGPFGFAQGMRWLLAVLLLIACAAPEPSRHTPSRVVSLAPNVTEILFALGAGDRVVGTDDFSDEPSRAKSLPK